MAVYDSLPRKGDVIPEQCLDWTARDWVIFGQTGQQPDRSTIERRDREAVEAIEAETRGKP